MSAVTNESDIHFVRASTLFIVKSNHTNLNFAQVCQKLEYPRGKGMLLPIIVEKLFTQQNHYQVCSI